MPRHQLQVVNLMRHAVTVANQGLIDPQSVSDASIDLWLPLAQEQASGAGRIIGPDFFRDALLYRSPYKRCRRSLNFALEGAGLDPATLRIYEDPDLREVDHGYDDVEAQEALRKVHGWFWYRFKGGESPAECYTRIGLFLHSFRRQVIRKQATRALFCTHGLTIRCLVMRWFHLTPEQFDLLADPKNCDIITIARRHLLKETPQFVCGSWGVTGLRFRKDLNDTASISAQGT